MKTAHLWPVVMLVLVAGCLDADGADSAMNARPEAESAALLWDESAELVGVFALATMHVPSAAAFANSTTLATAAFLDENVGDGRPHVWFFAFRGTNRTHGAVVGVSDNGALQESRFVNLSTIRNVTNVTELRAIDGWLVDSDHAIASVRDRVPDWRGITEHESARAWYLLRPDTNATLWEVRIDHGPGRFAVNGTIDATTGEVLSVEVAD